MKILLFLNLILVSVCLHATLQQEKAKKNIAARLLFAQAYITSQYPLNSIKKTQQQINIAKAIINKEKEVEQQINALNNINGVKNYDLNAKLNEVFN